MLGRVFSFIILISTLGILAAGSDSAEPILDSFQKRIPIANTEVMEDFPGIAFCPATGQYLVVFIKESVITGQRLDALGNLMGAPFAISSHASFPGYWPVVACAGGSSSHFVVAWLREGAYFDILIQAVHANPQVEPDSQLLGGPISTGGYYQFPSLDCSDIEPTCLLLRNEFEVPYQIIAQRLEVTESGAAFLGDSFQLPYIVDSTSVSVVAWNSLDQNYLVVWQLDGTQMAFTHVHAAEQGPEADEIQHFQTILFEPGAGRFCNWPAAAFNSATGKFLVAFTCKDSDDGGNPELILRRVDGTGTGMQGDPVRLSNLGGAPNYPFSFLDVWTVNRGSQFVVSVETTEMNLPQDQLLFLIPVLGAYDPGSPDQSAGQTVLFQKNDRLMAVGAGDPATGRAILALAEFSPEPNVFGYLFAPYVYRLTQIYKN
jgi:hypothetical protein